MSGPILLVLRILLVLVLYSFLGWALYTLWNDLRRQSAKSTSPQSPPLVLERQVELESSQFRFTVSQITIGRSTTCDCQVDDHTVSATHARLSFHSSQWWVEDLRSRNGTFLNQEKVTEELVVASGDELRCGQVIFQIQIGDT
jgi:pSer/pThr/pTyr-binding forkhead associated (FHA) protein